MSFEALGLPGLKRIYPKIFKDDRGFFLETYHAFLYAQAGIPDVFVQDNHSWSKRGTLRGMHFQRVPGQAKLVSVVQGKIFDVVVDIRPESPAFGQWQGVYLDGESRVQLFIPVGFAHGFCVLSESADVVYKVSSLYDPAEEKGFRFDDPAVGICWPVEAPLLSPKDRDAPSFKEAVCTPLH